MTEYGQSFKSYLGMFEAPNPWGPWKTLYYDRFGAGVIENSVFYYNLSNYWSHQDEFVLVFSGIEDNDSWNAIKGRFIRGANQN